MSQNLFTYGTLSIPEILSAGLGRKVVPGDYRPATLAGFRRHAVRGVRFPVIRRQAGAVVAGFYLRGITAAELIGLDAWESSLYQRILVRITTADGVQLEAWVYADTEKRAPVLEADWDREDFIRQGNFPA